MNIVTFQIAEKQWMAYRKKDLVGERIGRGRTERAAVNAMFQIEAIDARAAARVAIQQPTG